KKKKRDDIERGKGSIKLSSKISRHGEVGIVANSKLPPIEIYNLNDEISKKFLEAQNRKLKNAGVIREEDIRADSDSRRHIGAKDVVFDRARRKDGTTG